MHDRDVYSPDSPVYTFDETCRYLNVPDAWLRRNWKLFKSAKVGRYRHFFKDTVHAFLEENSQTPVL